MSGPTYVVLDTETTGLDPVKDQPVEVAWWATRDGWWDDVKRLVLPHDAPIHADAAVVNGYFTRDLHDRTKWASRDAIYALNHELDGVTIVGANPAFDTAMLSKLFRWVDGGTDDKFFEPEPWHYRSIDIESVAYGLGYRSSKTGGPAGLNEIANRLRAEGHPIPEPDHTAIGDVLTTAAIFKVLCPF